MIRELALVTLLLWQLPLSAQLNFDLGPSGKVSLKYTELNHFMLLDIKFNNALPLQFIFDTGSEHTLLFKKEYADLMGVEYDRRISLMGSDLSQEIYGFIARGVSLKLANSYGVQKDLLVLEEDYLQLEETTGIPIDGIVGANIFKYFVLGVNNKRGILHFQDIATFKPPKSYTEIPIRIYKNKPYIDAFVSIGNNRIPITLLIDSGAALAILLYTNTSDELQLPDRTITGSLGSGLGGQLEGYLGRINDFQLGEFKFDNLLCSFQDVQLDSIDMEQLSRNGILGNSILSRFNYYIDYPRQMMYIKANKRWRKKFRYDKSGLEIAAVGPQLSEFIIHRIQDESPGQESGFKRGDLIRKINGFPSTLFSLPTIHSMLSGRAGKVIRITVVRDGEKIKKKIKLRQII